MIKEVVIKLPMEWAVLNDCSTILGEDEDGLLEWEVLLCPRNDVIVVTDAELNQYTGVPPYKDWKLIKGESK